MDKNNAIKLDAGDNKGDEYKVEAIWDSAVYAKESKSGYLLGFYYLVSWKGYLEEKNTWEPTLAVQHLRKLVSSFYKDHPNKPTATSKAIDTALPIAKPIVKLTATKQKRDWLANSSNKQAKKNQAVFDFYCVFGFFTRCG